MRSAARRCLLLAGAGACVGLIAVSACRTSLPSGPATTAATSSTPSSTSATGCATPGLATTVAYRTVAGVDPDEVSLDVHAPARACRAPVVLWVHGGGYHAGDKANQMADKVRLFTSRGWILVSVNYRLTVPGSPVSAQYPDHFDDVAASVAWVHQEIGAYGGDPSRIALLGHSAGADIVANVAAEPRYLRAHGLGPSTLDCIGPLDTEGFDKIASARAGESAQWKSALGNNPDYLAATSATRLIAQHQVAPPTIGVYRGTTGRQAIEKAYLAAAARAGAHTVAIDAVGLSHEAVHRQIGAVGDTVMTPPLMAFLTGCFAGGS